MAYCKNNFLEKSWRYKLIPISKDPNKEHKSIAHGTILAFTMEKAIIAIAKSNNMSIIAKKSEWCNGEFVPNAEWIYNGIQVYFYIEAGPEHFLHQGIPTAKESST